MPTFVLIPSPFVGAITWQPTAAALRDSGWSAVVSALDLSHADAPYWPHYAGLVAAAVCDIPKHEPLVLVAHSAAGLLIPTARTAMPKRSVHGYIFVDATLPHDGASLGELIPASAGVGIEQLRVLAQDGLLPLWGAGWPDELWRQLLPNDALRARLTEGLEPAPLALYEERLPFVPAWPDAPCSYVRFSALYAEEEQEARRAGRPTREVRGEHLHMLVEPTEVARVLVELAT